MVTEPLKLEREKRKLLGLSTIDRRMASIKRQSKSGERPKRQKRVGRKGETKSFLTVSGIKFKRNQFHQFSNALAELAGRPF